MDGTTVGDGTDKLVEAVSGIAATEEIRASRDGRGESEAPSFGFGDSVGEALSVGRGGEDKEFLGESTACSASSGGGGGVDGGNSPSGNSGGEKGRGIAAGSIRAAGSAGGSRPDAVAASAGVSSETTVEFVKIDCSGSERVGDGGVA